MIVWGLPITGFGLTALPWDGRPAGAALAAGLALLAVAGWADVISAVFRTTIVQLSVPAGLLGRLSGLQIAVVTAARASATWTPAWSLPPSATRCR
ncbi:MAG TPA: hypothetical protein VK586_05645 [Streptosporangiaceae bacterium]|nr:hypothetical protein [Streptosporangiaceae bacterium]